MTIPIIKFSLCTLYSSLFIQSLENVLPSSDGHEDKSPCDESGYTPLSLHRSRDASVRLVHPLQAPNDNPLLVP